MRKCFLSFIALTLAASASASAQATPSADEIIACYAQRMGGAARRRAVQSVRKSGRFYGGGGFEAVVTNEYRRPNKVREEFTFGGMTPSPCSYKPLTSPRST